MLRLAESDRVILEAVAPVAAVAAVAGDVQEAMPTIYWNAQAFLGYIMNTLVVPNMKVKISHSDL